MSVFVYQAQSSLGELQISLCYLPNSEKIKVGAIRARNLKHADMDLDTREILHFSHHCVSTTLYLLL